jgi:molybdopterin molybdotransferase
VDDPGELASALSEATKSADVVLTCGGVSVGDYDFVPQAVAELGGEVLFHRLSIKPGKPLLAARVGKTWVLGLPGNPVSSLVTWRFFARPLCGRLAGDVEAFREQPEVGVLTRPAACHGRRMVFAPAMTRPRRGATEVTVPAWKGSHDVVPYARADALAVLDVGAGLVKGDEVRFFRLEGCGMRLAREAVCT